jgi:hypothetical protein
MAEASIDKLTLDIVVNNDNAARRINNITKAIEKLNTAVSKSGNIDKVIDGLNNVSPTSTRGGKNSKGGSNKKDNVGIFATIGKWSYLINMTRYYGRSLANIVQLAMDYTETQNLWQVANRNNIALASEFIDKMSEAYGISEQTLMNYQALFKTMLSSLGDLSDMMSTTLSQQITQMALDFSSLYNVSIADAMTKFQAVLSGQVRPIRSVSGYDITENTIFDIYSGAGGEKTMRQLSQLEKRLLRIYAIYSQMSASGAKDDLSRTIESASNQARIMNEQFKELMTWSGQIILHWLNSVGLFKYINALLMTMTEVVKAIAYDSNAVPENFFDGMFENVEDTNDAVDELQGKLLSFDKFETLKGAEDSKLGIDPIIEDLISKIDVGFGNVSMEAKNIADNILKVIGLEKEMYRVTKQNGEVVTYTKEQYEALSAEEKKTFTNVEKYRQASESFKSIASYLEPITIFMGILAGSAVISGLKNLLGLFVKFKNVFSLTNLALTSLVSGILIFVRAWDDMSNMKRAVSLVIALVAAVTALDIALAATSGNWVKALSVSGLVAGGALTVMSALPKFAEGGFPEDGLFFANSGELVGQFSNGKTAVANNDQIIEGIKRGVKEAIFESGIANGSQHRIVLDGSKLDNNTLARGIFPALRVESKRLGGNKL